MRGINIGCGKVILPCEQPAHHRLIPANIYTNPDIQWDNADRAALPGVNVVMDLFDYPWREAKRVVSVERNGDGSFTTVYGEPIIPDNTYDVAIAAHICEHIPHHLVMNGQFVHYHPDYQDGWFAWFANLHRILKPGGKAYILVPYAWSNGGISDPTHTRYLTPASFGYFNESDTFTYAKTGAWNVNLDYVTFTPHELGVAALNSRLAGLLPGEARNAVNDIAGSMLVNMGYTSLNMLVEFMVTMEAVK